MKLPSLPLLVFFAATPIFPVLAIDLANSLTIIVATEWTNGIIDKIPIRKLEPDIRIVNGLSLQRVNDLQFDQVGQSHEFTTAQTGWGGYEYYQVSTI